MALVINNKNRHHNFEVGILVKRKADVDTYKDANGTLFQHVERKELLAVGDYVVRGPDWHWHTQDHHDKDGKESVGQVTTINASIRINHYNVDVKWGDQEYSSASYEVSKNHLDIKHAPQHRIDEMLSNSENKIPEFVHKCPDCGWIFDESKGWEDESIEPFERTYEELADECWYCNDCGDIELSEFNEIENPDYIKEKPKSEDGGITFKHRKMYESPQGYVHKLRDDPYSEEIVYKPSGGASDSGDGIRIYHDDNPIGYPAHDHSIRTDCTSIFDAGYDTTPRETQDMSRFSEIRNMEERLIPEQEDRNAQGEVALQKLKDKVALYKKYSTPEAQKLGLLTKVVGDEEKAKAMLELEEQGIKISINADAAKN